MDAAVDMDVDEPGVVVRQAANWDVVAVVKRKMVFAKRPMPIVGKPPSAAPQSRSEGKT